MNARKRERNNSTLYRSYVFLAFGAPRTCKHTHLLTHETSEKKKQIKCMITRVALFSFHDFVLLHISSLLEYWISFSFAEISRSVFGALFFSQRIFTHYLDYDKDDLREKFQLHSHRNISGRRFQFKIKMRWNEMKTGARNHIRGELLNRRYRFALFRVQLKILWSLLELVNSRTDTRRNEKTKRLNGHNRERNETILKRLDCMHEEIMMKNWTNEILGALPIHADESDEHFAIDQRRQCRITGHITNSSTNTSWMAAFKCLSYCTKVFQSSEVGRRKNRHQRNAINCRLEISFSVLTKFPHK